MTKARILATTVSTGSVLADGVLNLTSVGLNNVENKSSATIRSEITSANVTSALGFTPYNSTNPSGYITSSALTPYLTSATAASTYQPIGSYLTGITSGQVTGALGFTPYNASNPSGYITSASLIASNITGDFLDGVLAIGNSTDATKRAVFSLANLTTGTTRTYTLPNASVTLAAINLAQTFSSTTTFSAATVTVGSSTATSTYGLGTGATLSGSTKTLNIGTAGVSGSTTAIAIGSAVSGATTSVAASGTWTFSTDIVGNITGSAATITGVYGGTLTSGQITGALGYTPYNSTNPSGYITSSASISGNAATATSSPLLSGLGSYVWASSTLPTSYPLGIQSAFVGPAAGEGAWQNYGSVMTMRTYSGGGGSLQLYVPYGPGNGGTGLQARFGNYDVSYGNAWTAWKTLLASDNFNSYAMPSGSSATNSVDVRAPLFYDSNDTGYYVDPNSTSNSALRMRGGALFGPNTTWGAYLYVGTNGNVTGNATVCTTDGNIHIDANDTNHGIYLGYYTGDYTRIYNSTRSPIYYDLADSGYYVDPNATSVVNQLNFNNLYLNSNTNHGFIGTSIYIDTINSAYATDQLEINYYRGTWAGISHDSLRAPLYYDYNDTGYYVDPSSTSSFNSGFTFAASNPTISAPSYIVFPGGAYFNSGTVYMEANLRARGGVGDDSNTALTLTGGTGGFTQINGSTRSPIFYDSNDTSYYCDPNSTSSLNTVQSYWLQNQVAVSADHAYGMYFDSGRSTAYAIYRASGAWTHPYPDLRIGFHTGIQIGANASYGGTRFYSDYDMASELFSVGNGDANVRVTNNLYTPIVYDSNNTGYYVDPATNTRLNALYADSVLSYGNVTAYASSDRKFKENIRAIPNALEIVRAVGGKLFDWTDQYLQERGGEDGYFLQKSDFGIVAQDLHPHLPQAVRTRQDGSLAVDYEKLCAVAFEAINALETRLAALERALGTK